MSQIQQAKEKVKTFFQQLMDDFELDRISYQTTLEKGHIPVFCDDWLKKEEST